MSDYYGNDEGYEDDAVLHQENDDAEMRQHNCSGCMECLGLSWSDFM